MHLLDWPSVSDDLWEACLDRTAAHAADRGLGRRAGAAATGSAAAKEIALVFFNDSLRTRVSMEMAARQLGAGSVTVVPGQGTWGFAWGEGKMDGGEAEHIREAVAVLSRYADAVGVRLFASGTDYEADRTEARLHTFAAASSVPVVNLESAYHHPCQGLADAAVIRRHLGDARRKKFVLSWAPHPKPLPMAVPNSALFMAARLGMEVTVARPDGFGLDPVVMERARGLAAVSGGSVTESAEQDGSVEGADIVYVKAWGGVERYHDAAAEAAARASHADWIMTQKRMSTTRDGRFMHCLPVRRGVVVEDAVLDGAQTLHLDQAEHRLHAQKAILEMIWGKLP